MVSAVALLAKGPCLARAWAAIANWCAFPDAVGNIAPKSHRRELGPVRLVRVPLPLPFEVDC